MTFKNTTITPSELNFGDIFYECDSGMNMEATVTSQPQKAPSSDEDVWTWKAVDDSGREVDYTWSKYSPTYGPRIYSEPQYVCSLGEGTFGYKTVNGKVLEEFNL